MCKRLRDILFPLNIFGGRVGVVTFDTSTTPIAGGKYTFNIEWEGRSIEVLYTMHQYQRPYPYPIVNRYYSVKHQYEGGGMEILEQNGSSITSHSLKIDNDIMYINCVGVTKLIINGIQII